VIPLADVQREILGAVAPLAPITVPVRDALGLVTTRDVIAGEAVPPFANTAMDGYAVRADDTTGAGPEAPVRLAVAGELPAGRAPEQPVGEGEAIRIMTGAPMPGAASVPLVRGSEGLSNRRRANNSAAAQHTTRAAAAIPARMMLDRTGCSNGRRAANGTY